MKKQIILMILLIVSTKISAQNTNSESKYYVGVSYGNSYPLGDFKSNNEASAYYNSGFANTGKKFDLFGGYNLSDKIGLTALIRSQQYATDSRSIANNAQKYYPGTQFMVDSKEWKMISLLIGGNYIFTISNKMNIMPKAMIGLVFAKSPEISVDSTSGNLTSSSFTESASTVGLAYELGLGLERKLGKHFALMPTFDFSGGFLTFNDLKTINRNEAYAYRNFQINTLSFNFGFAIAYRW